MSVPNHQDAAQQDSVLAGNSFFHDIVTLRENARGLMAAPALRANDNGKIAEISVALLQNVLAAEIVCVLRYTTISVSPIGLSNPDIGSEFHAQANDERQHMEMTVRRIRQLGGVPDFNPACLMSRVTGYGAGLNLMTIIQQNLALEELIVAHYRELLCFLATTDPETSLLLEQILQDEENHSADLNDLLAMQNSPDGGASLIS